MVEGQVNKYKAAAMLEGGAEADDDAEAREPCEKAARTSPVHHKVQWIQRRSKDSNSTCNYTVVAALLYT